jgi:hypothetical protein
MVLAKLALGLLANALHPDQQRDAERDRGNREHGGEGAVAQALGGEGEDGHRRAP